MAGSQREQAKPYPTIIDPVLSARLESVKLLAERLSEPVAIIDRKCNLVYANRFGLMADRSGGMKGLFTMKGR